MYAFPTTTAVYDDDDDGGGSRLICHQAESKHAERMKRAHSFDNKRGRLNRNSRQFAFHGEKSQSDVDISTMGVVLAQ